MILRRVIKYTFLLLLVSSFSLLGNAQKAKKQVKKDPAFLNNGITGNNATISVSEFKKLVSQPLIVRDEEGHQVNAFAFILTYKSLAIYSDSTGREQLMTDEYNSSSDNGVLPEYWVSGLLPKIKAGDTALFTDIFYPTYTEDSTAKKTYKYAQSFRVILK